MSSEPTALESREGRPIGPSQKNAMKTECLRGHEFTEENTMLRKRGASGNKTRVCRECDTERRARRLERDRARRLASKLVKEEPSLTPPKGLFGV